MSRLQSLFVIYSKNPSDPDATLWVKVFHQATEGVFTEFKSSKANGIEMKARSQPTFLDINGDMIMDFIYVTPSNQSKVAVGKDTEAKDFEAVDLSEFIMTPKQNPDCQTPDPSSYISTPHSNSFIDLDGDCMPDLYISK
mmetsp:Transcript_30171/g.46097  ORF Transcript_30171/g.46097 Transcript_30171/m.46097 type:complete len:140 (+) Transcript_30171:413-832(+)